MKRRAYFLTDKQIDQLEHAAAVSGLGVAEFLRRIIDKHFT